MSDKKSRGAWGSRIGYILSTLGMAIGVGAMWRFPMLTAKYGGGAFVLAFFLISIIIVIPAAWGEVGLGRHTKSGVAGALESLAGKKGKVIGTFIALIPLLLMFYYPVIMANVVQYIYYTVAGSPFLADPEGFYNVVANNKIVVFLVVAGLDILTGVICLGGIKGGIEKACKILLPALFVILVVLVVRICTLPGIMEGIEFYVRPDFSQWANPKLWVEAAGMALFAIGCGPGYLITFGSYCSDKADIGTDLVTVNITQMLICVLSGFAMIPAVILFGMNPDAGSGLIFMVLPKVFEQLAGGPVWLVFFLIALLFAGLSTTISAWEVPVTVLIDSFGMKRRTAVIIVTLVAIIGAVPCIWISEFLEHFDYLVGTFLYTAAATGLAVYLAWFYKAKRVREEWINPTSVVKYGAWEDVLFKFLTVPVFIYFLATGFIGFFS